MIALLQRVTRASVSVNGAIVGQIGGGLMVLVGVQKADTASDVTRLAERLVQYRVFEDAAGKMNLSLTDTGGAALLVPQFTLAADTRRGRRPSFSTAAPPDVGKQRFDAFCHVVSEHGVPVETGEFGADMQVELINDGPVTFWLETGK